MCIRDSLKTIIWNGCDIARPSLVVIGLKEKGALGEEVLAKIVFAFGYDAIKYDSAEVLVDDGSFADSNDAVNLVVVKIVGAELEMGVLQRCV